MARQKGIIKLKGKIGDVSFYKTKDGYLAREKGGIDGDRIRNDPSFQRTRENGLEFGRAGKGGKVLRDSLRIFLQKIPQNRLAGRLTREMMRVIKSDTTNIRGSRTIRTGNIQLLAGFDLNPEGSMSSTLFAPFTYLIDRATGSFSVNIPSFSPAAAVAVPGGATHMQFLVGGAAIDFVGETFEFGQAVSNPILLGPQTEPALNLVANVASFATRELFLVLGVEFVQEVNGIFYPLKNGAFNPLTILAIDQAP